jgi:hypothetical protein
VDSTLVLLRERALDVLMFPVLAIGVTLLCLLALAAYRIWRR